MLESWPRRVGVRGTKTSSRSLKVRSLRVSLRMADEPCPGPR